jgi:hypothetical protein
MYPHPAQQYREEKNKVWTGRKYMQIMSSKGIATIYKGLQMNNKKDEKF